MLRGEVELPCLGTLPTDMGIAELLPNHETPLVEQVAKATYTHNTGRLISSFARNNKP